MRIDQRYIVNFYQLFLLVVMQILLFSCTIKKEVETVKISADGPFHAIFKLDERYYNSTHEWVYFNHDFEDIQQFELKTKCRSFKRRNNDGNERIIGNIRLLFEQPLVIEDELYFELNERNSLVIRLFIDGSFYTLTTNENNSGYLKLYRINSQKNIYSGEFSAQFKENDLGIKQLSEGELEFEFQ